MATLDGAVLKQLVDCRREGILYTNLRDTVKQLDMYREKRMYWKQDEYIAGWAHLAKSLNLPNEVRTSVSMIRKSVLLVMTISRRYMVLKVLMKKMGTNNPNNLTHYPVYHFNARAKIMELHPDGRLKVVHTADARKLQFEWVEPHMINVLSAAAEV